MKIIIVTLLLVCVNSLFAQTNHPDAILGVWKLENGLDVKIYKKGSQYFGDIVALNGFNKGQTLDEHNSEKERRKDKLVGKTIIFHLEYDKEEGVWDNGKMYAPHMGMYANLEIKSVDNDIITAVGSKLFFWHTEHWKKVN